MILLDEFETICGRWDTPGGGRIFETAQLTHAWKKSVLKTGELAQRNPKCLKMGLGFNMALLSILGLVKFIWKLVDLNQCLK